MRNGHREPGELRPSRAKYLVWMTGTLSTFVLPIWQSLPKGQPVREATITHSSVPLNMSGVATCPTMKSGITTRKP